MHLRIADLKQWELPSNGHIIHTIDMHTAGEPLRILVDGIPNLTGNTLLEKRRCFKEQYDYIRKALIFEPRGHADMYAAVLLNPCTPEADLSVFFLHNEGYSSMCGHAILAICKLIFETNLINIPADQQSLRIETPAGMVYAQAHYDGDKLSYCSFENVPSFIYLESQVLELAEFGKIQYDIAYGGAFYAVLEAAQIGIALLPENAKRLIQAGKLIKQEIMKTKEIKHPFEDDLGFLYGCIFIANSESEYSHSKNVCIFADGELDRSPTGSGISARIALEYFKHGLQKDQDMTVESIIGSRMQVEIVRECEYASYKAVVPQVSGEAFFTGKHRFYIDPEDPLKEGFIIR